MDIEARMHEVEREIISRRPEHSVDLALDRDHGQERAIAPGTGHDHGGLPSEGG